MTLEGNLCRICLKKKGLLDLYEPKSSDMLSTMLTACTNITLNEDDGLPPYICISCTRDLEKVYHFKILCEKSEALLQQTYVRYSHHPLDHSQMSSNVDIDLSNIKMNDDSVDIEYGDIKLENKDSESFTATDFLQVEIKKKISFEEPSDLKTKIGDHVLQSSNAHNERQQTDFIKTQQYLKTKKCLTVKKIRGDKIEEFANNSQNFSDDNYDEHSEDDGDYDEDDDEEVEEEEEEDEEEDDDDNADDDDDYKPNLPLKQQTNRSDSENISHKQEDSEMLKRIEARIKNIPTIIKLGKYKNVGGIKSSTIKKINGKYVKVYKSKSNKESKSTDFIGGKRGRKPFLTRDETGKIIRPKHQCYVCGLMTADIKQHMTSHSGEKSHTCDTCNRRFSTRGNLIHHMKIHTGVKSHVCQVCGAAFIYGSCLQRHLDIHTGTKPHKCHLCDKSFQLAQGLRRHLTVHEGARPHACHMCPARFNQPHQLKTHIRSHTGEKPYVCSECGEAFTYKYVLNNHVKKHAASAGTAAASSVPQSLPSVVSMTLPLQVIPVVQQQQSVCAQ